MQFVLLGVRRPWTVIAVVLALTAALALPLSDLRLEADGRELLAPDHPARVQDAALGEHFQVGDSLFVVVIPADSASADRASADRASADRASALPSSATMLLAKPLAIEAGRIPGLPAARQISLEALQPGPGSPVEADVPTLLRSPRFAGTLVGFDRASIGMLLTLDGSRPREDVLVDLRALVDRLDGTSEHRVVLVGELLAQTELTQHLLHQLLRVLPAVALIVALLLWLSLRSPLAVALSTGGATLATIWVGGLMALTDTPIDLTSAVIPVVLIAVGVCDDMHLIAAMRSLQRRHPDWTDARILETALRRLWRPLALTTLTTAAAFASFLAGDVEAIRAVGLFSGLGVLASLALSVLFLPAVWTVVGLGAPEATSRGWLARLEAHDLGDRILRGPSLRGLVRVPGLAVLVAVVVTLIATGLARLEVRDSWVDNFAFGSEYRHADALVTARFAGTSRLLVEVDAGAPDAWHDLDRLATLRAFEARLEQLPEVGATISLASFRDEVERLSRPERLPRPVSVTDTLSALRTPAGYHFARTLLDRDGRYALVQAYLGDADSRSVGAVLDAARAAAEDLWPDGDVQIRCGGDPFVSHALVETVVEQQVRSLATAFAVAWLLLLVALRSPRLASLAMLPCAVTALVLFAVMGLTGIGLGLATSLVGGIAVGIGVDYAIHLVSRYRLDAALEGDARRAALRATAPVIVLDAVVVGGGMLALLASGNPSQTAIGLLTALALACAATLTVTLLPRGLA